MYSKDYNTSNYMRWVKAHPQYCKHPAIIPSSLLHLEASPVAISTQSKRLKWNISIIAVGNAAGYAQHMPYWQNSCNGSWRARFKNALIAALTTGEGNNTVAPNIGLHEEGADWWTAAPTALKHDPTHMRHVEANRFSAKASSKQKKHTTPHENPGLKGSCNLSAKARTLPGQCGSRQKQLGKNWNN
jgi:hypothetical protein